MIDTDSSNWLRIRETASLLNVSGSTVGRWLADGRLQGWKEGGVVRVSRKSVDRFLKNPPVCDRGSQRPAVNFGLGPQELARG